MVGFRAGAASPVYGAQNGAPMTLSAIAPGYTVGGRGTTRWCCSARGTPSTTLRLAMVSAELGYHHSVPVEHSRIQERRLRPRHERLATAHIWQVTAVSGSPADLSHAASSIYNVAGGHANWPAGGYATGARVYRVAWVTYKVDDTRATARPASSGAGPGAPRRRVGGHGRERISRLVSPARTTPRRAKPGRPVA